MECFLYHPNLSEDLVFPLDYNIICLHQQQDAQLQELNPTQTLRYPLINFDDLQLICYVKTLTEPWRIAIPNTLLSPIIKWYHIMLSHVGMTRLYGTISTHFYHPQLQLQIAEIVGKCDTCQRAKLPGSGYGELPTKGALVAPWYEVAVDLIGPWKVKVGEQELVFQALTCIDTVSNLAQEVVQIDNLCSNAF